MTFFLRDFFHGKRKFTALIAVGIMLAAIPVLIRIIQERQDIRQRASETTGVEYNVKNYGAIGDGLHHPLSAVYQNVAAAQADYPFVTSLSQEQDWAGIQKAINSVSGNGLTTIIIPPGIYKVENIIIQDKSNLRILGNETTLELSSDVQPVDDCASDYVKGVNAGIQLIGSITNLTIENLVIHGQDGIDPAECAFYGHAGIWEYSGQNLTDIKILNNTIRNVRLGIGVSASGGGSVNGVLIQGNRIENAVGVRSGEGYGIATGNLSLDTPAGIQILNNTIINAERHAIYQGWGTGVTIANNTIRDHRTHIPNQALRAAIVASRSRNVAVEENTVDSFNGGAVEVSSATGVTARNISVTHNTLTNPRNNSPTLFIGSQNPNDQEPAPELVVVRDNTFSQDGVNNSPLHILSAKQLQITNNTFSLLNTPGPNAVSAIVVSAVHQAAGSHNFIDDLAISNNTIVGSNNPQGRGETHGFMITTEAAQSSARIVFSSNQVTVPDSIFYIQSAITNPNISFITPTPAEPAAGDINRDGRIDTDDFIVWRNAYLGIQVDNRADINRDGSIDIADFNLWNSSINSQRVLTR